MLNVMRKYAGSWMIKVLLAAIVLVFVFWGVGSFKSPKETQVATVNGEIISVEEYQQVYNNIIENYRRQFGDKIDDRILEQFQLGKQAVDQLINQKLLLQEAEKLGFRVTDQELVDRIKSIPAFQDNGAFDKRRYIALLNQNRLSVEEFEQGMRQQLAINKLQGFVSDGVKVSEDEAWNWYAFENKMVSVEYVLFNWDDYKDIKLSDEDVQAYFDKNKEKYRTQPKMKVQYLKFDPKSFAGGVTVNDDEVQEYYDAHPEEFHKAKTIEARHILFKAGEDADQETLQKAKQKATDVLKLAREGKDFAELAKTHSEGPSKDAGGMLGAFERDKMVKPFADAAFELKAGEISDLVKTQFGYHIIKVEKVNPEVTESLEKVRPQIRAELINARSKSIAYDRAEEVNKLLYSGEDLSKVAKEQQLEVRKTDFFTQQGPQKGVEDPSGFAVAAFELKVMDISEVKELGEAFYVIQPIEKIESKTPPLSEVRDRVESDLNMQKQEEQAEKDAKSVIEALKQGDNFTAAVKPFGQTVKKTGFFKRDGNIPEIGYEMAISDAVFGLSDKENLVQDAVRGNKGYYVLRVKEHKGADSEGFEKEKADIQKRLLEQKKGNTFNAYIVELKKRSQITVQDKFIK